jgi:hypothetical protein
MKNLLYLSILLSFQSVCAVSYPGSFILKGYGANGIGLGGTYTATVRDPSALYWNPAGLANISGEISELQAIQDGGEQSTFSSDPDFDELLGDIENIENQDDNKEAVVVEVKRKQFEFQFYNSMSYYARQRLAAASAIAFTLPVGTLAFGAQGLVSPELEQYDSSGSSLGSQRYMAYAGHSGYALQFGSLRIGTTLTGFQEDISGTKWHGALISAGIQVSPIPILAMGVTVHNLAGVVQRSAGVSSYRKPDTVLDVAFAISTPPPSDNLRILVGFQGNLDQPESDPLKSKIGAAYAVNSYSYLIAGLNGGKPSAGLGFDWSFLRWSYSLSRDELGTEYEHHTELNFIF